jgi:hypothetical protein
LRKVTFGVANSLDNFIARKDHAVDWPLWTKILDCLSDLLPPKLCRKVFLSRRQSLQWLASKLHPLE